MVGGSFALSELCCIELQLSTGGRICYYPTMETPVITMEKKIFPSRWPGF